MWLYWPHSRTRSVDDPAAADTRFPRLVIESRILSSELRNAKRTIKSMIRGPLFDLRLLIRFAAKGAGTSDRRHQLREAAQNRDTSSSGERVSLVPSLRRLTSTLPSARPLGPTMICQGMPIR